MSANYMVTELSGIRVLVREEADKLRLAGSLS
jgi:hypothetical protein